VSKIVVLTDRTGYYEFDEPVPQSYAAIMQREFRKMPWPPMKGLLIWGEPVEIEDRRPAEPTVRRIDIDMGPRSPEGSDKE